MPRAIGQGPEASPAIRVPCARPGLALLCAVLALCGARPAARATTVVPMRTRDLVASSIGAVRGRVTRIEAAADPERGAIHTYIWIEPSERIFGALPAGTLVLRELGGRVRGRAQWIFGSPEYRVGESVLVFLSRNADGSLHTTAMSLGKYEIKVETGILRAVRRFGARVAVLDPRTGAVEPDPADEVVELPALLERVRKSAAVAKPRRPPLSEPPELHRVALESRPSFVLLNPNSRWFEPDIGIPIGYAIDTTGDAKLGLAISRAAVVAGMGAWNALEDAPIELFDSGDDSPAPFAGCPDSNRIVFNDPFGELDDPSSCRGVLAIGGFCNSEETRTVGGTVFHRIIAGKVTFNNGWGNCAIWTPCNFAEIATHELGHTIGLGHSDVMSATMAKDAHFDGRCSSLTDDERAAIAFVYPIVPTPTPTPTWTPTPIPTSTGTRTETPTRTGTATRTGTVTRTPRRTSTRTRTATSPRTSTPTRTLVPSRTATASITHTASQTRTPSATRTQTSSPSPPASPSRTATSTLTATRIPTPSATPTLTPRPRPGEWLDALLKAVERLSAILATRK